MAMHKGAVLGGSPALLPSPGILKYIMVLMVLIFPEILLPAVVHLRYLDQFGALGHAIHTYIVLVVGRCDGPLQLNLFRASCCIFAYYVVV